MKRTSAKLWRVSHIHRSRVRGTARFQYYVAALTAAAAIKLMIAEIPRTGGRWTAAEIPGGWVFSFSSVT